MLKAALIILLLNAVCVMGTSIYLEDAQATGFRWLDAAGQQYSSVYRNTYNYSTASVRVDYDEFGTDLRGTLNATHLKPNFAYQLKLAGYSGTTANEKIGLAGRWWQEEWSGSAWVNGQNLNNKGNGSSPNPNDLIYFSRYNITDATSPTGSKYKYTGYLVFDYFITDENGSALLHFDSNSSYHVLWKTSQRSPGDNDGALETSTFDPYSGSYGYDTDYGEQTVSIFGEWERLPTGGVYLESHNYTAQIFLTEESFHSSLQYGGSWAAAMFAEINFSIAPPIVFSEGWNLIALPVWPSNLSAQNIFGNRTIFGYDGLWSYPDIINPRQGYWVKANASESIRITGRAINESISLQPGWNLIGYPMQVAVQDSELANKTIFSYEGEWRSYEKGKNNSLTTLKPGMGYWVRLK